MTNYNLYTYQKRAVDFALKNKQCLLWMCRGSGKTLVAIDLIQKINQFPVLIVTPASVKTQFKSEIQRFYIGDTPAIQVFSSKDIVDPTSKIMIVNPDILEKYKKVLRERGFKVLIVDESHYFKTNTAQRTKALRYVSKDIEWKYCMTGSAITQAPIDLFAQFSILRSDKFGGRSKACPNRMSWYEFAIRYSGGKQGRFGFEAKRATNVEELRERCKNLVFRVKHEEALKEIPEVNEIDWSVELSKKARKLNDRINKDFEAWLREQGLSEYDVYRKLSAEALVKLNEMRQIVSRDKAEHVINMARDIGETDKKVIIFCAYQETVNLIKSALLTKAVTIVGSDKEAKRNENIEQFKFSDKVKYCIINIKAGGVGINLQNAHNIIFADLPFNYSDYDQCVGRSHRHGQKEHVNVYKVMCKDTIDEKVNKYILHKKQFEKVL